MYLCLHLHSELLLLRCLKETLRWPKDADFCCKIVVDLLMNLSWKNECVIETSIFFFFGYCSHNAYYWHFLPIKVWYIECSWQIIIYINTSAKCTQLSLRYTTHSSPRQLMIITIYLKCKIILYEVLHQEEEIRTEITTWVFWIRYQNGIFH